MFLNLKEKNINAGNREHAHDIVADTKAKISKRGR